VTGRRRHAVIDASPGLGEAVVSGAVNPDRYTVDTRARRILDRRLGDKRTAVRPVAAGGTETVTLPDGALAPCLTDEQIIALTALGDRVQAHFGRPQDIEWAIDAAGTIWLVQARPITTLYPLPADAPTDDEQVRVYFSANVAQGMFRPFTPMGLAAFRLMGSGLARIVGRPVAERRAGPPALKVAGDRLFVDITPALRSSVGRRLVPRLLDVMEARSSVMVRALLDDQRLSVIYGARPVLRVLARIAVRFAVPLIVLRALLRPQAARRHIERLADRTTHGLTVLADPTPAEHLRLAERMLTERMPHVPPRVIPDRQAGAGGRPAVAAGGAAIDAAQRHHGDGPAAVGAGVPDPARPRRCCRAARYATRGARPAIPGRHARPDHPTPAGGVPVPVRSPRGSGDRHRHAAVG
jgi:pyruvate,water dikinase